MEQPPEILIARPIDEIREFHLVLSLAGDRQEIHSAQIQPLASETNDNVIRFQFPEQIWQQLKTNAGYWWNVWAVPEEMSSKIQRAKWTTCFVRHLHLVRLGSNLKYKESGALPVIDLGVQKQLGWESTQSTPDRPEVHRKTVANENYNSTDETTKQRKAEPQFTQSLVAKSDDSFWRRIRLAVKNIPRSTEPELILKGNVNVLDGYLDQVVEYADYLHVVGWKLLKAGPADVIEFESADGQTVKSTRVSRPDLEFAFPQVTGAAQAGFEVKLRAKKFKTEYGYEFTLVAKSDGEEVSRVNVTRFVSENDSSLSQGPFWFGKSDRLMIG